MPVIAILLNCACNHSVTALSSSCACAGAPLLLLLSLSAALRPLLSSLCPKAVSNSAPDAASLPARCCPYSVLRLRQIFCLPSHPAVPVLTLQVAALHPRHTLFSGCA